jgi:hypothetical protein
MGDRQESMRGETMLIKHTFVLIVCIFPLYRQHPSHLLGV